MTKKQKAPAPKVGTYWVRKRDRVTVQIHSVSRAAIEYVTYPMLLVWPASRSSFAKNFRPATTDEAAEAKR